MTRRELFHELGGLDTSFSPAYFEDADYCVRLWRTGWRVVYLPDIAVRHHENASSTCPQNLRRLYQRNHTFFTHKHTDWLSWKRPSSTTSSLWARSSHEDRFRVLLLPARDASKTDAIVRRLRSLNCFITVYPLDIDATISPSPTANFPPDVEVLTGGRLDTLPGFLAQRRYYYDCILASDPEILEQIRRWKQRVSEVRRDV
jgi:cellulose synthase/poly-beta-1,6-N-acetylglucosamine synthase-like glycosyltransferase